MYCASPEGWESSKVGGNAEAQAKLGKLIERGIFIAKDLVCEAEYSRLSAEQGNADGRFRFGVFLENGGRIRKERVMAT
jgi:TPR repeat protein